MFNKERPIENIVEIHIYYQRGVLKSVESSRNQNRESQASKSRKRKKRKKKQKRNKKKRKKEKRKSKKKEIIIEVKKIVEE